MMIFVVERKGEPMRLIDGDALYKELNAIRKEEVLLHGRSNNKDCCTLSTALYEIEHAPTIEPERKKDTVQKFHDYQVEWLLSHCDLELEPRLEEWVVRFLHDTANCYMMEIDRKEGDTP